MHTSRNTGRTRKSVSSRPPKNIEPRSDGPGMLLRNQKVVSAELGTLLLKREGFYENPVNKNTISIHLILSDT